jgi:hypothetical protein
MLLYAVSAKVSQDSGRIEQGDGIWMRRIYNLPLFKMQTMDPCVKEADKKFT